MHVDLTACSLKREEVLFLGLALSMSKTMLSLHLTGNTLPYYDRIFLRSVIAARVGYRASASTLDAKISNNKEYTQVMHLASGANYNPQLQDYIRLFNQLDGHREGLDFEIQEMLDDIDAEEAFQDIEHGLDPEKIAKSTRLGQLFDKMKERGLLVAKQQKAIQDAQRHNPKMLKD